MKIIVTGGAGYIGSAISATFVQAGHEVFVIDRVPRPEKIRNVQQYEWIDFASDYSLAAIRKFQADVIVHCAGTSLVGPSITNPAEYYDNNISKTIKLLNFVKALSKQPLVLFSSSASVYGEPDYTPILETAKIQPISPYGNTKAMTEIILRDYASAYGIKSVSFRYFNAAGAIPDVTGQEPGATHIVARVLEASISKTPFKLYGDDYNTPDGTCIRDYVHIQDIADAHLKAVTYMENNDGSKIFNLGSCTGISNKQIIDYVTNKYGLDKIEVVSRRPGDPAELVADPSQAFKNLGWQAQHSTLEEIVDSAYAWYTRK